MLKCCVVFRLSRNFTVESQEAVDNLIELGVASFHCWYCPVFLEGLECTIFDLFILADWTHSFEPAEGKLLIYHLVNGLSTLFFKLNLLREIELGAGGAFTVAVLK